MTKRFVRMIIKAVGYAAGVVFIFDFSFTDWGIGLLLASAAVAVVCVFIWTHFDLGDTYDENEPSPKHPPN
jgi:hypothetical protein